jgi:hypothetical protein
VCGGRKRETVSPLVLEDIGSLPETDGLQSRSVVADPLPWLMTRGASDYSKIKIKRIVGQYLYGRQDQAEASSAVAY